MRSCHSLATVAWGVMQRNESRAEATAAAVLLRRGRCSAVAVQPVRRCNGEGLCCAAAAEPMLCCNSGGMAAPSQWRWGLCIPAAAL
jgi:hypothetical protein